MVSCQGAAGECFTTHELTGPVLQLPDCASDTKMRLRSLQTPRLVSVILNTVTARPGARTR